MSKIISMVGTRPDGVKITFTEEDVDKIRIEHFSSVEIVERMSDKECLERYGKSPLTLLKNER